MTAPQLSRRQWVVLLSTAVALVASLSSAGQPWRGAAVFWFVAVAPGLSVKPWPKAADPLERAVLAVAVSLASAAVVSEMLALARVWSAPALMAVLAAASVAGCVVTRESP